MADPFSAQVLKALDNKYRFIGGPAAPRAMDISGAITPVEDLSRASDIGSGVGLALGYGSVGTTDVHAGAGTIFTTHDPYDLVDTFAPVRAPYGVWLTDIMCNTSSSANFVDAGVSLSFPVLDGSFSADDDYLAAFFPDALIITVSSGRAFCGDADGDAIKFKQPVYMPDGTTIRMSTQAVTGAATIRQRCLIWAGAKGALPPGVA